MIEIRNYEFVTVTGPDAKAFLQGQVTCDVEKLSKNNALAGAICNLKGRVIADFLLALDGEDCVLRTQSGMAGIIKNTLAKYACLLYTSPSPRDGLLSRMPSSA